MVELVYALGAECREAVKGIKLAAAVQQGDTEIVKREPEIHLMRLPNSSEFMKIAPYIIVQLITEKQMRVAPPKPQRTALVRFIFCIYNENEEEGSLALLNLMEAVQKHILKALKIGKKFTLDPDEPFEAMPYPDDSEPFFGGELIGMFHLPPTEQEVDLLGKKN